VKPWIILPKVKTSLQKLSKILPKVQMKPETSLQTINSGLMSLNFSKTILLIPNFVLYVNDPCAITSIPIFQCKHDLCYNL